MKINKLLVVATIAMTGAVTGCTSYKTVNFYTDLEMNKMAEAAYCAESGLQTTLRLPEDKLMVVCKGAYGSKAFHIISSKLPEE